MIMSLTREQWIEMWNDIKKIEEQIERTCNCCGCNFYGDDAIKAIKDKIELVIGQMRTNPEEL